MAQELISSAFLLLGAAFMLIAAAGVLRMPDLYTRMHASTKSATLGVGFLMLGVIVHFGDFAISVRALAISGFFMVTAPVAAHVMGRAGYFSGVPLWRGTLSDALRGRYDPDTHTLRSAPGGSEGLGDTQDEAG